MTRPACLARKRSRGFTLIEILVAMAILAVVASISYGGLHNVLDAKQQLEPRYEEFSTLQLALLVLGDDIDAALARPVRDELGSSEPAFGGGGASRILQLTRQATDYTGQHPANMERVEYRLEGDALVRLNWPQLDRVQGMEPLRQVLLAGLSEVRIRFYGQNDWQTAWPLAGNANNERAMPTGVELSLQFADGRALRRILLLGSRI